jgi:hypothetical protein
MNRYFPILFIVACCFISCESVVTLDVPHEESKLVVNSFFNPDSTFRISLHQSRFVLEEGRFFETVSGAKVMLFDGDKKLAELEETETGIYEAIVKPEAGKEYTIQVSKEGFKTVTATERIPADSAKIIKYEASQEFYSESHREMMLSLSLWLDDPEGIDFYEIYGVEKSTVYTNKGDTLVREDIIHFSSGDPIFTDYMYNSDFLYFDDTLFDGEVRKITFSAALNEIYCSEECVQEDKITVYLRKVSESYFKYIDTNALQREIGDNPFAEPVIIYNNIENGFGIFAGYQTSELVLEVSEETQE